MKRIEIDYNKIYYNTKGKAFKIIKELNSSIYRDNRPRRRVLIRFIESEYETETDMSLLCKNPVPIIDYLSPTLCGVGIIGYAIPKNNKSMYNRWSGMIRRCYDRNYTEYINYGDKGVTVCERWKRFDYFLEDIVKLPGYEDMINNPHIKYQLDKDILQQGIPINQKVYSPETCIWVPININIMQKIIDNKDNYSNPYFGVYSTNGGNYRVTITHNGEYANLGTYSNPIAAANSYNYYCQSLGLPVLNKVPYMDRYECVKYLIQPLQMLVDKNRLHGVYQLPYGRYRVGISINGNMEYLGIYTNPIAAANIYNYYNISLGRTLLNDVPYMPIQECIQYLTKLREMCNIIN